MNSLARFFLLFLSLPDCASKNLANKTNHRSKISELIESNGLLSTTIESDERSKYEPRN